MFSHRATAQEGAADSPKAPFALPAENVRTHTVSRADIVNTVLINGELRAAQSREITVPRIRSGFGNSVTFLALEGTAVKQGERIVEFDASALLSQKSEAERRLDETKLLIEKTKADLEVQRADLLAALASAEGSLKVAQLYGKIDKELLPANQYQKYQLDLEKATLSHQKAKEMLANHDNTRQAQLSLVEVDRQQAELNLKKIESDLSLLSVDAPLDGIVIYGDNWASNRKIQVGDTLFPGMPVVTLPDLSTMQVIGYVYDTELSYLSPDMACDLRLDAVPGKEWHGRIVSLTSVASRKGFASQHKVFRATIQPDSIDLAVMKPGMTVRAEVPVVLASQAVTIPRECLGADLQGRYFVMKSSNQKPRPGRDNASMQLVEVGAANERLVQIVSGLSAGEQVLEMLRAPEAKP
jgi:HlyD family secretion protein